MRLRRSRWGRDRRQSLVPPPPRAGLSYIPLLQRCRRHGSSRAARRGRRRPLRAAPAHAAPGQRRPSWLHPPLFQAEAGDVFQILRYALVAEEEHWIPNLEGLACPEEQRELADVALGAHHRRQDDAAGAVVGHLLGGAESHQGPGLVSKLGLGVELVLLELALDLGVLQRRIAGVVGGQDRKSVV